MARDEELNFTGSFDCGFGPGKRNLFFRLFSGAELAGRRWATLRDLEYASLRLETEDLTTTEELRWLKYAYGTGFFAWWRQTKGKYYRS